MAEPTVSHLTSSFLKAIQMEPAFEPLNHWSFSDLVMVAHADTALGASFDGPRSGRPAGRMKKAMFSGSDPGFSLLLSTFRRKSYDYLTYKLLI